MIECLYAISKYRLVNHIKKVIQKNVLMGKHLLTASIRKKNYSFPLGYRNRTIMITK